MFISVFSYICVLKSNIGQITSENNNRFSYQIFFDEPGHDILILHLTKKTRRASFLNDSFLNNSSAQFIS